MSVLEHGNTKLKLQLAAKERARRKLLADECEVGHVAGRLDNQILPKLSFTMRDPRSLKTPDLNVKKVSPSQAARLAASIERLQYVHPVLISATGEIIDGLATVAAAIRLGLKEVPTVAVDHLDPNEISLLRIALNGLPQRAEWDADNLRIAVTTLIEADMSLDFVFEPPQIDLIIAGDEPGLNKRDNAQLTPDVVTGESVPPASLWRLGDHWLIQGDARDPEVYRRLLGSTRVRTIITDPPWDVGAEVVPGLREDRHGKFAMGTGELGDEGFIAFLSEAFSPALEHLTDGGLLYSFIDWRHIRHLIQAGEGLGMALLAVPVWVKSQGGMGSLYRSQHEFVGVFKKGNTAHVNNVILGRHGRDRTSIWRYPGATTAGSSARAALADHPTPKSVEMIADAILDVTHRGDAVLDMFAGSGTTLIAAQKTRRVSFNIEFDPRYVEVILRRWQKFSGEPPLLHDTGETLDEVVARSRESPTSNAKTPPSPNAERLRVRIKAGRSTEEA